MMSGDPELQPLSIHQWTVSRWLPLCWGLWGAYLAVDAVLLSVGGDMFWHIWLAPFWLLWAAMARRLSQQLQVKVIA